MKRCSRCGDEKPLADFPRDPTRRDELFVYCRECRRAAYRAWYQRNRGLQKARVKARVAELQTWFRTYKQGLVCQICGESEPVCLEFHHLDPTSKEDTLSRVIAYRGWSIARVLREAAKCAVLCANCHRKVHAGVLELPGGILPSPAGVAQW